MESLQIKGVECLTEIEKQELQRIADKHYEKIKRMLDNEFSLRVSIKAHSANKDAPNKRKKYSITINLSGEIPRIEADAFEWDFNKALNSAFAKVEHELEHRFHLKGKH